MSLTLHVVAVGEHYSPVTGGNCIIRKFSQKYQALSAGDRVLIHHTADAKTVEIPGAQAISQHRVSSTHIATLDTLWDHHKCNLHDIFWEGTNEPPSSEHILRHYPLADGEERNHDELFVAIYF